MHAFGIGLSDQWTAMWNGDLGLVDEMMAPEFVLRHAQAGTDAFDGIRTPPQPAETVAAWHRSHDGLLFTAEGTAVVDLTPAGGGPTGSVARPYLARFAGERGGETARSGIDILRVSAGLIVEVWSVSSGAGGRTFHRRVPGPVAPVRGPCGHPGRTAPERRSARAGPARRPAPATRRYAGATSGRPCPAPESSSVNGRAVAMPSSRPAPTVTAAKLST